MSRAKANGNGFTDRDRLESVGMGDFRHIADEGYVVSMARRL